MSSSTYTSDVSLCSRRKKLNDWLEQVFESEEIPSFDENEGTLKALYELMDRNLRAEKDANEIITLEKKFTELYNQKSEELATRLDLGNLTLSSETSESVDWLSKIAKDMNLREPTHTNFLLAFCEAESKKKLLKKQNKTTEQQLSTLSKKVAETMKENEVLKRNIKKLKETSEILLLGESKTKDQEPFFAKKCKNYKSTVEENEKYLENAGFEYSLSHHELMAEAEKLEEIESKVIRLTSQLESYKSLPPNKELALLKIEELEAEIKDLEDEFQNLTEKCEESFL